MAPNKGKDVKDTTRNTIIRGLWEKIRGRIQKKRNPCTATPSMEKCQKNDHEPKGRHVFRGEEDQQQTLDSHIK